MDYWRYITTAIWCTFIVHQVHSCLQTNNLNGLPHFQGYGAGPNRRIPHNHQAIIPSYRFNCCGNITEWGVDLNPATENGTYDFDLQVWRPSPTPNETGCYSLVSNFMAKSISLSPQLKVTEQVARLTPLPHQQLQFQPGDVLGFYVESHKASSDEDNGVVLLHSSGHSSELVWYAMITSHPQTDLLRDNCPYPVGTGGVLNSSTHAAPVISISISSYTCLLSHTPTKVAHTYTYSTTAPCDTHLPDNPSTTLVVGISAATALMTATILLIGLITISVLYCWVRMNRASKSVSGRASDIMASRCDVDTQTDLEVTYDYPNSMPLIALIQNESYGVKSIKLA